MKMLLRFSAANFLSIREAQTLSLTAASLRDSEKGLISCPAVPGGRLLPAAVIYGANASGKSNLVRALGWMRDAILVSHREGEPGGGVPREPFALDSNYSSQPSVFELDFYFTEMRYHYGFQASDTEFLSEWLYAFPKGKRQILFQRELQEFKFGRALEGQNRIISQLTRPNSLFVSAAAQNDHKRLSELSSYIKAIKLHSRISVGPQEFRNKDMLDDRVIRFLAAIGTGVSGYRYTPEKYSDEEKVKIREFAAAFSKLLNERINPDEIVARSQGSLELSHRSREGENVYFGLDRESAGTRRLLALLDAAFRALDQGSLLVVDELDASLHTQACEAVLQLFSSSQENSKGAQLIATTHDTNLLSSPFMRRDQVWFTEKDSEGATHLYPLTDIRSRKGDSIERGYLQGRYGAIPFAGRIPDTVWQA